MLYLRNVAPFFKFYCIIDHLVQIFYFNILMVNRTILKILKCRNEYFIKRDIIIILSTDKHNSCFILKTAL